MLGGGKRAPLRRELGVEVALTHGGFNGAA
jgi:hypothetical protein